MKLFAAKNSRIEILSAALASVVALAKEANDATAHVTATNGAPYAADNARAQQAALEAAIKAVVSLAG